MGHASEPGLSPAPCHWKATRLAVPLLHVTAHSLQSSTSNPALGSIWASEEKEGISPEQLSSSHKGTQISPQAYLSLEVNTGSEQSKTNSESQVKACDNVITKKNVQKQLISLSQEMVHNMLPISSRWLFYNKSSLCPGQQAATLNNDNIILALQMMCDSGPAISFNPTSYLRPPNQNKMHQKHYKSLMKTAL